MRVMVLQHCSSILYMACESATPELVAPRAHQSVRAPPPSPIRGAQHPPTTTQHTAQHRNIATALHSNASVQLLVHARLNSTTRQFHGACERRPLSARCPPHASLQGITVSDCRDCTTATALEPVSQAGVGRSARAGHICGMGASPTWNMGLEGLTTRPDT
jgi:hypothetical protein